MIVKNEEKFLDDCLKGIKEIVDEIVIVDTGSTDDTIEIAQKYNARIFHFAWNYDFSQARNFSISQATCDWILVLDADERIEKKDLPKIRKIIRESKKIDGIYMTIWNQGGNPASISVHYLVRLFRRKSEIRYKGKVHELVMVPNATHLSDIKIIHLGYHLSEQRMEEKYLRDLNILLECNHKEPNNPILNFYIARTYYNLKKYAEALIYVDKSEALVELPPQNLSFYVCVLMMKANILMVMNKLHQAESVCQKGLQWMPGHLDVIHLLGTIYWSMQRFTEAVLYYRKYLLIREDILKDPRKGFHLRAISALGKAGEVYSRLAEIYFKEGNYIGAIGEMKQALKFNPSSPLYYYNLGTIYATRGQLMEARHNFQQALYYQPLFQKARDALDKIQLGERPC
ncbi:TPR domain-containing glycosyltransferase [Thermococcus sp.]|uniref:glycosyltransferase n=1 Tax=Thermococcus sp. TaxID=35749 RepID=UPI00261F10BF|nr:TPR domain-containing glycosyltransferase [Thermococcus sp.]MCD6144071.1 tetratricopeptide repeat protein [Thermococcus sp.]